MNPGSLFRLLKAVCREAAKSSEKYWKKGVLIMKVSYYDLFDMIAEDAGKLLSQAEQSPIHPENYSPDTTITAISGKIKETDIIKDIEHAAGTNEPFLIPKSITHFAVKGNGNSCTTPEIIFDNGVMVIFTKEDGSGWHLKKGETLVFESTEYPSEINAVTPDKGQCVGFYYVFNNTLMRKSDTSLRELDLKYELTAEQDGEYYICLIGASSDPISLMEGKIYKR